MDWCLRRRNYSFFRSEFALRKFCTEAETTDKAKLSYSTYLYIDNNFSEKTY